MRIRVGFPAFKASDRRAVDAELFSEAFLGVAQRFPPRREAAASGSHEAPSGREVLSPASVRPALAGGEDA
jgi:hypothetical protein